jgi:hypothetical protein
MTLENNFVCVTPSTLADPIAKLTITPGRWSPESGARGGSAELQLSYDPELSSDQLTDLRSAEERKTFEMFGGVAPERRLYRSERARTLTSFFIDIHDGNGEVRLQYIARPSSLALHAGTIGDAGMGTLGERPYEVLLYALQSIVLIENWETEYAAQWGKAAVSLAIPREAAEELAAHTGAAFEEAEGGLVRIAVRTVRS